MKRALALLPLALLALASYSGLALERARRAAGSTMSAARVPLGGFEPLAVGIFWMRAEKMRRSGRLVDAVASYRLIAELEPHVAPAFALPARLLAFTASESADPEMEWGWVSQALEFLKTGLRFSPDDPTLIFELGFILYSRLALDEELRPLAAKKLGRMPEELAAEEFRRLPPAKTRDALLADSLRLLGERRLEAGNRRGALAAFEEALPLWKRLTEEGTSPEAVGLLAAIERRIEELRAGN